MPGKASPSRRHFLLVLTLVAVPWLPAAPAHAQQPKERAVLQWQARRFWCLAFSPDGKRLLTGGDGVYLWDPAAPSATPRLLGADSTSAVAFSPDGKSVAWGAPDRKAPREPPPPDRFGVLRGLVVIFRLADGHRTEDCRGYGSVAALAFTPNGKCLVTSGLSATRFGPHHHDLTATLWDTAGRKPRLTLPGGSQSGRSLALSPDGKTLLTAGHGRAPKLWEVVTGGLRATFQGHQGPVLTAVFHPSGKRVASAGQDNTVRLWDSATGKLLVTLEAKSPAILSLAFSPDGKLLASGEHGGVVRVWDLARRTEPRRLSLHTEPVYAVAFSPDGKTLASASLDRTVRLWDVSTLVKSAQ
jgi:WD40 repeat protein